jgi:hypothetical protein
MIRRSVTRVLLSLLLLLSQQMALTHVLTHWSGRSVPAVAERPVGDASLSRSIAQDQWCDQCLSFAQIAGAVGSPSLDFVPFKPVSDALPPAAGQPACARTVCPFDSRAPPFLA